MTSERGGDDSEHIGSSGDGEAWSDLEGRDNRICSGLYLGCEQKKGVELEYQT